MRCSFCQKSYSYPQTDLAGWQYVKIGKICRRCLIEAVGEFAAMRCTDYGVVVGYGHNAVNLSKAEVLVAVGKLIGYDSGA